MELTRIRIGTDIAMLVSLSDSDIKLSWDGVEVKHVVLYSDTQHVQAGRGEYIIDPSNPELMQVKYKAGQQCYLGAYRLVVQFVLQAGESDGRTYTADVPCFELVATTEEVGNVPSSGDDDDVIGLHLDLESIDSSLVQELIDACINAAEAADKAAEAAHETESTVSNNEAKRVEAESIRQQNESVRITNEKARQDAEALRLTGEKERAQAETGRVNAESSRVSEEESRNTAESERAEAEKGRAYSESQRVEAEGERVKAEAGRSESETKRTTAESERAEAELLRARSESDRSSAETLRQEAESVRSQAEAGRVAAENGRVSAEEIRVGAEQEREKAEALRQEAETKRQEDTSAAITAANKAAAAANDAASNVDTEQLVPRIRNLEEQMPNKVDKVKGKELSTNDYTNEEKQKLSDTASKVPYYINGDLNNLIVNSAATEDIETAIGGFSNLLAAVQANRPIYMNMDEGEYRIVPAVQSAALNTYDNTGKRIQLWFFRHLSNYVMTDAETWTSRMFYFEAVGNTSVEFFKGQEMEMFGGKQTVLETDDKTVLGAINELKHDIDWNIHMFDGVSNLTMGANGQTIVDAFNGIIAYSLDRFDARKKIFVDKVYTADQTIKYYPCTFDMTYPEDAEAAGYSYSYTICVFMADRIRRIFVTSDGGSPDMKSITDIPYSPDLAPYLTKTEAEQIYATKEEIQGAGGTVVVKNLLLLIGQMHAGDSASLTEEQEASMGITIAELVQHIAVGDTVAVEYDMSSSEDMTYKMVMTSWSSVAMSQDGGYQAILAFTLPSVTDDDSDVEYKVGLMSGVQEGETVRYIQLLKMDKAGTGGGTGGSFEIGDPSSLTEASTQEEIESALGCTVDELDAAILARKTVVIRVSGGYLSCSIAVTASPSRSQIILIYHPNDLANFAGMYVASFSKSNTDSPWTFMQFIQSPLTESSVIDNLNDHSATSPLSANQGRVLAELIAALESQLGGATDIIARINNETL